MKFYENLLFSILAYPFWWCWFVDVACQPFSVPQEICPGDSPDFKCTVEDMSGIASTYWTVTVNMTASECTLPHPQPNRVENCGPSNQFEARFDPAGRVYSSTLTVRSISPFLNGTSVWCAGPAPSTLIGTSDICIVGQTVVPPQFSSAISIEAGVGKSVHVVTLRWSDPVLSCNGSISRYVLTVSPPIMECPSGSCVVGRGDEKREQKVTVATDQMYSFTVRADSCNSTQAGEKSDIYTLKIEAKSDSCQYYKFEYNVHSLVFQAIRTTWKRVYLGSVGEANYALIISPGGQRQPATSQDCNSTHCSYTFSSDGSLTIYAMSAEAVGCVTRVMECKSISSRCDPDELVVGVENVTSIEMGYAFLEGQVTYNGLTEGSTAMYTPNEGYLLSVCSVSNRTCHNGVWSGQEIPTFEKISGSETKSPHKLSYETAIATTGVVCTVVSLIVGALLGMLLHHLITRAQNNSHTKHPSPNIPVASYEAVDISTDTKMAGEHREVSIDLMPNQAYTPVENRIVTRHNQAYGQVQL